jgi:hypothetical protein
VARNPKNGKRLLPNGDGPNRSKADGNSGVAGRGGNGDACQNAAASFGKSSGGNGCESAIN